MGFRNISCLRMSLKEHECTRAHTYSLVNLTLLSKSIIEEKLGYAQVMSKSISDHKKSQGKFGNFKLCYKM